MQVDTPIEIRSIDLMRFLDDARKRFIQIGPRTLSVNQLKPYNAWEDFKCDIEYAYGNLCQIIDLAAIQRIGLRYINLIEIPMEQDGVNLDKYFGFRPFCGPKLSQLYPSFMQKCTFPYLDGRDLCNVELRDATPERGESMTFVLSIDYFLAKPRSIHISRSIEWVKDAHIVVEEIFEGCILPPLREIFQEVR